MIDRLVLLGATGDLAGRFLLPALATLTAAGDVPPGLRVVGAGHQDWDDDAFREHVATRLRDHAPDVPAQVQQRFVGGLRYRRVDLADPASVASAVRAAGNTADGSAPAADGATAVYLALPPTAFPDALRSLAAAGLPPGSRVAVEKPFGHDLASARDLDALLEATAAPGDLPVFRVDHILGLPRVRDLVALRAGVGPLGPVWNGARIEQVDVLWEETLGLHGRADFYDRAGAVRDVLQNHLLQVLALIALEEPGSEDEEALHAAKREALAAVRTPTPDDVRARTRRARYTAGTLAEVAADGGAGEVLGYAQEAGVDPGRGTETHAELQLEIDTPRWTGTRFVVRTGKAMAVPRKGVLLHFREPAPDGEPGRAERTGEHELWIELDGPGVTDAAPDRAGSGRAASGGPGSGVAGRGVGAPGELSAYTRVLTDVLSGGSRTSVSLGEVERAWTIVDPVLRAWAADEVPLREYPAGSSGPTG